MPTVSIITCSYNKHQFVMDTINSVLNQTFTDFEYFILENSTDKKTRKKVHNVKDPRVKVVDVDFTDKQRRKYYVESKLKNDYFPKTKGKYIMVLADDDYLEPDCFETHLNEFKENPQQMANYHACNIKYIGTDKPDEIIPAIRTLGPRKRADHVDGGSVMINRIVLEKMHYPYFKGNWNDAHISDSLFLRRLSDLHVIHPINKVLHTKRVTKISTHVFVDESGDTRFFRPKLGGKHPTMDTGW